MKFNSVNVRNDLSKGSYRSARIVNVYDNGNYATAMIGNDFEGDYFETPWFIPARITPKSNVYKFLVSVGIIPVANEEINFTPLVGLIVDIKVDTKVSKKDGNLYSNIVDIELSETQMLTEIECSDDELPF